MGRARPVFLDSVGDTGRAHMVPVVHETRETRRLSDKARSLRPPIQENPLSRLVGYCFSVALRHCGHSTLIVIELSTCQELAMPTPSDPAALAAACADAIVCIATLSSTSCPFLRMARSKLMASADSVSPLALAKACVTFPISFVPLGRTVLPPDFTLSTVRAVWRQPLIAKSHTSGRCRIV
jgi:hypothetical protein